MNDETSQSSQYGEASLQCVTTVPRSVSDALQRFVSELSRYRDTLVATSGLWCDEYMHLEMSLLPKYRMEEIDVCVHDAHGFVRIGLARNASDDPSWESSTERPTTFSTF